MGERLHDSLFPGFREMSDPHRAIARRLLARRQELGLSQTQVAARMGTSQSAVARIESGSGDVRLSSLERMAEALGGRLELKLESSGGDEDV